MSEQEPVGFSDADILSIIESGGENLVPSSPAAAEEDEDPQEYGAQDNDGEGGSQSEDHANDTPADDGKKIPRANKRFMQLTEQKRNLELRVQELENATLRAQIENENLKKANELIFKKPDEEPEEVLDEVLDKKTTKQIEELKSQLAETQVSSRLSQERQIATSLPEFDDADSFLTAATARQIQVRANALGQEVSDAHAISMANQALNDQFKMIAQHNKKVGAIAEYVYNQAKINGWNPAKSGKASSEIDMKAVQKARDTASAPTIERQVVTPNTGDWHQTFESLAKEDGVSQKRMKAWL